MSITFGLRMAWSAVAAGLVVGASAQSFVLVVDSTNDRIVSLNGADGSVANATLVGGLNGPVTGGNSTPKAVIDSGRDTLYVTDQLRDHVLEVGWDGTIIGPVAPWALDNVKGLARIGRKLLVTNAGAANGAPGTAIVQRDLTTGVNSVWANNIDAFDLVVRQNDVLVTNITDDRIDRYDLAGNFLNVFNQPTLDTGGMNFPQQIAVAPNGDVYVAVFSTPGSGLQRFDANGNLVRFYGDLARIRGVGFLDNGDVVTTDGATVWATVPDTGADRELLRTGSYQYVTRVEFHPVRGQVTLQDWHGEVAGRTVTLELTEEGLPAGTKDVTLDAAGRFEWSTSRQGNYGIRIKTGHWLGETQTVTLGGPRDVAWSLVNGDIDGDNVVTVFDYDALSAAFDSVPGDANWNPAADLDGDLAVTVFDYDILSQNFDRQGDE